MPLDRPLPSPLALVINGSRHIIGSLREAAWLLADAWPDPGCAGLRTALAACAAALEGRLSVDEARAIIRSVAEGSGIAVEG
ncbi:DUF982 domain-containing protein [Rhizobium halophytocola]|uniref:DUF982 domain-containing protein n=1 Tax=Rhizobium halophytocola TaxID=735519 RepID=A0ABS4DVV6_9HYPH|nr:DUF982 domain-containing protein [Rhizobium halophytocola]MBP1849831.1 hypothetical protein [Rhizobium halophytocola]